MSTAAKDEFDKLFADSHASRHPEDDDSAASNAPSHDDDADSASPPRRTLRSGVSKADSDDDLEAIDRATTGNMRTRYFLPRKQQDANTGPKGVIADAYAFESAKKASQRTSFLPSLSLNGTSAFTPSEPPVQYHRDDEKGLSDEEDEDEFLRRWRQARLNELQTSFEGGKLGTSRKSSPSGGRWGTLATVDAEGYLDAVERSPRGTVVAVLIYDDACEVSNLIGTVVRQVARRHASTRFVRLHYEEAEFEAAGVPAILAYKDGEKFAGLVPLMDELPDQAELTPETLESVLQKHQIL